MNLRTIRNQIVDWKRIGWNVAESGIGRNSRPLQPWLPVKWAVRSPNIFGMALFHQSLKERAIPAGDFQPQSVHQAVIGVTSAVKVKVPSASTFIRESQPPKRLPLVRDDTQRLGEKRPDNADRRLDQQPHKRLNLRAGERTAFVGCHVLEFSQRDSENKS